MSNQTNYTELVPSNPKAFPISRIAEGEGDVEIIQGRVPGQFGFDADDVVEMHFYNPENNVLVGSVAVPISSGIITSRTIILPEGNQEEKVVIDMTRVQKELGLLIPPGLYSVTLNFFSNEIGEFGNPKMIVEEVSPSRTELRLGFATGFGNVEQREMFEFVEPSIPRVVASGFMQDILGTSEDQPTVDSDIAQTPAQEFADLVFEVLRQQNSNLYIDLADTQTDTPDNLELTINFMAGAIYDEFVSLLETTKNSKDYDRLQVSELSLLVERAVDNAFKNNNPKLFTGINVEYIADEEGSVTVLPG